MNSKIVYLRQRVTHTGVIEHKSISLSLASRYLTNTSAYSQLKGDHQPMQQSNPPRHTIESLEPQGSPATKRSALLTVLHAQVPQDTHENV